MNAPVTRRALLGATAAVGATALPSIAAVISVDPDADLLALIARWPAARAAYEEAGRRSEAVWDLFVKREPEQPDAMHRRHDDGFGILGATYSLPDGRSVNIYERDDVEKLRAMPPPSRSEWRGKRTPPTRTALRDDGFAPDLTGLRLA